MQIQQIIMLVAYGLNTGVLTFFAVSAFFMLRRQEKELTRLKVTAYKALAVVSCMKLQGDFDRIGRMKTTMKTLVEHEAFEDAKRLKAAIECQEEAAAKALKDFNEMFGEEASVSIIPIPVV